MKTLLSAILIFAGIALSAAAQSVTLAWNYATNATFNVYCVTNGVLAYEESVGSTTIVTTALAGTGVNSFFVTAVIGGQESGPSNTVTTPVSPGPPTASPASLSGTEIVVTRYVLTNIFTFNRTNTVNLSSP